MRISDWSSDVCSSDLRWAIRRSALSRQLVLDAQNVFTRRLQRPVTENEARNLLGNLADYVWMLVQWEVSGADPHLARKEKNQQSRPRGRPRKPDTVQRKKPRQRSEERRRRTQCVHTCKSRGKQ